MVTRKTKIARYKSTASANSLSEGKDEDARTNEEFGRALIATRDARAYCELLSRFRDRPLWFARKGCPEEVEAVLWRWFERGATSYDPGRPFEPFFLVSVRYEYRNRRRRRRHGVQPLHDLEGDLEPSDGTDIVREICDRETAGNLAAAIQDLAEAEQAAVVEIFLKQLTYRAVSEKLHVSLGTLERTVKRALARLAVALDVGEQRLSVHGQDLANPARALRAGA